MKLVPANRDEIRHVYKKSKNLLLLEEFIASGMDCARVENLDGRSHHVVASSIRQSAKRYGLHQVEVFGHNGHVYLARKEDK